MATQEVFMDIPAVEKVANTFKTFGDTIKGIATLLEALSTSLKAAAFISFGATAAVASFIDSILPAMKNAATEMQDISGAVLQAVQAYQTGDATAKGRFI